VHCSHHHRKSHESDGQAGIVQEELMAYLNVCTSSNCHNNKIICIIVTHYLWLIVIKIFQLLTRYKLALSFIVYEYRSE